MTKNYFFMAVAKNIVVYTALFGKHSGLVEQKNFKGIDFICYTDRDDIQSKTWQIKKVELPVRGDATRSARYYKLNPHEHLDAKYDVSIWIDANVLILQNVHDLAYQWTKEHIVACFDHNVTVLDPRDCVYEECDAIIKLGEETGGFKDDPQVMLEQMQGYRDAGFPEHYGLIFSAVVVRKHKDKDAIALMQGWWHDLKNGSKRDQLSFNFNVWKLGLKDKVKVH